MFRTILVPLDGSTFGEHALPLALELAQKTGATLHLAHVLVPLSAVFADAPPFVAPSTEDQILEEHRATERQYLETTARRLSEAGAPCVQTSLLDGDVPEVLSAQVNSTGADLVVMATHGYGPFTRFWLGSVADELVRSLPIPLLLIRPAEEEADLDKPPPLNHILLPLDGSELAEQMVEPAAALASAMGADVILLRVIKAMVPATVPAETEIYGHMVQDLVTQTESLQDEIRTEAQDYLIRVAAPLRQRGLTVRACVEAEDTPARAILRHAESADMVALATHGYRGLSRLFLGSVADKVIRNAQVPVLVVKPRKE